MTKHAQAQHDRAVERLTLCSLVLEEVREQLVLDPDPDRRAELLLTTEDLAANVIELTDRVRDFVWNLPTLAPFYDPTVEIRDPYAYEFRSDDPSDDLDDDDPDYQ
jgi:hypothetical protein